MKRIMVVGAGQMGSGIAQVAATAGFSVALQDVTIDRAEAGKERIAKFLERTVSRGSMTVEERSAIIARIRPTDDLATATEVDVVIEAVPEVLSLKKDVFSQLETLSTPTTLLASNTSTLSITEIAAATRHPDRVVGMHFFYPPPRMALIEIIPALQTSQQTVSAAMDLARRFGKTPVQAPDTPGFLVNRLLVPMLNEAAYLVMEGSKPEDVDAAMKLGTNMPMGPLELADFVGLDTLLFSIQGIYDGLSDPKYRPCPLLRQMVQAGYLGRKSGRGFYDYTKRD